MEGPFIVVIIFGGMVFFGRCSPPGANSSRITKTSLTTVKMHDGNLIPKPTNYMRRISVEHVKQSSDGLGVTGPHRRKGDTNNIDGLHDVWQWDSWCQLQPKSGNCSAERGKWYLIRRRVVKRFYYEAQVDSCKPFRYSGCSGNKNNFATLAECERHCKAASRLTLKESKRSVYCALQPNVGMCLALIERYYYDISTNKCKTFIYGGCGGNQNRFDTIARCEERCKN